MPALVETYRNLFVWSTAIRVAGCEYPGELVAGVVKGEPATGVKVPD